MRQDICRVTLDAVRRKKNHLKKVDEWTSKAEVKKPSISFGK